ncbi:hypothetical protein P3511_03880 [Vibrio parahaemolyticus]|uniref:hypothetical protein n=1 Tax=Vibrio alginolyticus TaxID=663 RepID=UPI001BD1D130|nr:hypothetical protein [Vibrio alginolyticus]MBS9834941.1 hypothetical protein [Vibrio alginolyticus]MDF4570309.1 hypothetical protein [Vibrio parahaemolyticus]HCM0860547.1 hypothetical protein [Vibrio parahaemolyticus]
MSMLWRAIAYNKFTIFALIVSGVFSYLFYPLMNTDSMNALVSIYSILAGFLIGVISLLGDPMLIPQGSWRVAQASSENANRSLTSTKLLLYIYLFTLLLIFLHKIIFVENTTLPNDMAFKTSIESFLVWVRSYKDYVDTIVLFFALLAFLFSFRLPSKLYEIQNQRVQNEIEARRRNSNIKE